MALREPHGAIGPGLGAALLVRRRDGAWDLGWDRDVYPQREGAQDLGAALNMLVAPSEPNRAWMGGLVDLLNEHGLWPPREVCAELVQRRHRVYRRRLAPSEQELLDLHGKQGLDLARAAEEAKLTIEQAREAWSRLEREAAWLAQWREDEGEHPAEGAWLDDSLPPDSFIVRDQRGREVFCPDRHSLLGETARLAGEPYWVSWKMPSGGMGYADGPLDHSWGTAPQADYELAVRSMLPRKHEGHS